MAWGPLGWRAAFFSEIDKFASAVLAHRHPTVPNLGDMTRFKDWPDAAIDVLAGGTPCQSYSNAGLRAGLDDPRGQLMLTYGAVAARYRPKWLVWENVPGVLSSNGGRDFGAFLGLLGYLGYGFAYRVLDAQFVRVDGYGRAVPQRRKRVFVVGCLGDWRSAAAVLLEREGLRGDPAPRRRSKEDIAARALCSSDGGVDREDRHTLITAPTLAGGGRTKGGYSTDDIPVVLGALTAACGPNGHGGSGLATDKGAEAGHIIAATLEATAGGSGWRGDFESETFIAHTLRGEGFDASEDGSQRGTPLVVAFDTTQLTNPNNRSNPQPGGPCQVGGDVAYALTAPDGGGRAQERNVLTASVVRRLTPRECERLQGFPDDYTLIPWRGKPASECPDGPRYKALGNSWAVNCPRWIARRINLVEQIHAARRAAA